MIRILIVDDHKLMREALCTVLAMEPDISVVGQAGDGEIALTQSRELQPDIVLMDIDLPDINGIEVTRKMLAESPAVRVLAVSTYIERHYVARMMEAGAGGYIHKASGREELLQGIRAVAAGTFYLSQNIAASMVGGIERQGDNATKVRLGKRETEVLLMVAEGNTSVQISAQLHIAVGTVEAHRYNIMRKLNLHSIAELTKYALRQGLISR
ncbi:MAG: response regulator transcription factor [Sterolibacterium sp.]